MAWPSLHKKIIKKPKKLLLLPDRTKQDPKKQHKEAKPIKQDQRHIDFDTWEM